MRVVICGGGVIGACTALFLARRRVEVIIIERTGVANAASGRAGGFLAYDWCAGLPLDALARRSFTLHAQLPGEIKGDWGYRRMSAYAGFVSPEADVRGRSPLKLSWLSDGVAITTRLGTPETTAIVHPALFTKAVMQAAQEHGARLRSGVVTGILRRREESVIRGVVAGGEVIEADAVVIALGPWSLLAAQWVRLPAVIGQLSPSLVFNTGADVPAQSLFLEYQEATGAAFIVEVFPRADGSTLVTAFSDEAPLPTDPADVMPDQDRIKRLEAICERLSPAFARSRIVTRQACFRPVTQDGMPLIGTVPGSEGAYVATGHNVWGILNAPATGEALAELIVDGVATSTDLTPFDPIRLRPLDPARLRAGAKSL